MRHEEDRMTQSERTNEKGQAEVLAIVMVGLALLFTILASVGKEKVE